MRRIAILVAGNLFVLLMLIVVVEGASSMVLFVRDLATTVPLAEHRHTRHDPELGWVNLPNVDFPDMYGPGVSLRTNAQGFRGDYDLEVAVPDGKRRVVCSGDSFTLGFGVSNDDTWCQQLTQFDPQIEPVNMGQGGYGLDQAYLWFKRDGVKFEHDVHLLAFITDDFHRMPRTNFSGYGKPTLRIEAGEIVAANVPVPNTGHGRPWLTSNWRNFTTLRTLQLLRWIYQPPTPGATHLHEETQQVARKVFEDLEAISRRHGSQFVLVYLPTPIDLVGDSSRAWIQFVQQAAADLDLRFMNLIPAFRSLPFLEASGLFIREGQLGYPNSVGHLNELGNEVVAELIASRLRMFASAPSHERLTRSQAPADSAPDTPAPILTSSC